MNGSRLLPSSPNDLLGAFNFLSQNDILGIGSNSKIKGLHAICGGTGQNSNYKYSARFLHVISMKWMLDSCIVHDLECLRNIEFQFQLL